MLDGTIRLADGRLLGYSEFGDPSGDAVLVFHGTPGARILPFSYLLHRISNGQRSLRIITPERPGYGLSSQHPTSTFITWTKDVQQLCQQLGIQRFSLVGIASGCAYALACASQIGQYVLRVGILSGFGPVHELGVKGLSADLQACLRGDADTQASIAALVLRMQEHPDDIVISTLQNARIAILGTPFSQELLTSDIIPVIRESVSEAGRSGNGMLDDYRNLAQEWPFDVRSVQCPVHFWHSNADEQIPLSHAIYLSELISGAVLHECEGVSHQVTNLSVLGDILRFLV